MDSSDTEKRPNVFAPGDLTDARKQGEWDTRYPPEARRLIRREAVYVSILLGLAPICIVGVWSGWIPDLIRIGPEREPTFVRYALAWLGGLLGGALITMKWLYHSVAHGFWNRDRTWWRLFTPHISSGLAFVLIAGAHSLRVVRSDTLMRPAAIVATAALIGLFSDNALAKLAEVAETLFGPVRRRRWGRKSSRSP
jgi:hypothetical protein